MSDNSLYNDKSEKMRELDAEIAGCSRCVLHRSRTRTVPGEGPAPAQLMFIGEAPGRAEDDQGRPFVGRAGKILTDLLEGIDIQRDQVFITSVVKCRPPNNRDPGKLEILACKPFLFRQILQVRPKIIVPMGRFATSVILEFFNLPFTSLKLARRNEYSARFEDDTFYIVPVYHPAVITHNPNTRDDLHLDFHFVRDVLEKQK